MSRGRGPSSQLSRRTWADATQDPRFHELSRPYELTKGFYTFMLLEDSRRAFPYRRSGEDFAAEIRSTGGAEPPTETIARALNRDRYGDGHRTRDLADALREFAEECIQQVLAFGEAAYELVFWRSADDDAWSSFDLVLVHPYWRRMGRHQHYIPGDGAAAGRTVQIPAESLILFRLRPDARQREVAAAVAILGQANGQSARVMQAGMSGSPGFATYAPAERELLARATRSIGWTGRDLFVKDALEPYRIHRMLQFALFHAELREMVVEGVNHAIRAAGQVLGFEGELKVEGVAGRQEVEAAMRDVQVGLGQERSLFDVLRSVT